ncbi:MAG TPA: hypothetical protein VE954_23090 [Oligoflexus sp.]|uniref:hypothetical protein n=1 Tax=Oligoflexus sp. TaxID=1971216 RepID=UPI002D364AC7|nr:hypothetical protein [Oligoflexus sp.]HYX35998.1 hypothetical protein [Oligoflexus sp.]
MFKLFWADIRQLKKPFLFLILTIPLLHYLDDSLFLHALPTTIEVMDGDKVRVVSEPFAHLSAWPFVIMTSVILLLFSHEAGGGMQGRLSSLASLPLSRWKIGVLRHLPPLAVVLALGLIFNVYRMILYFGYAMTRSDIWRETQSVDLKVAWDALRWAGNQVSNAYGDGPSSLFFQASIWAAISFLILGIPLLIDDVWPGIKRSSFALWLSVSLFIGVGLQVAVFALGRVFGLTLFPTFAWPSLIAPTPNSLWHPSIMSVEIILALCVLGLELWRFQNRKSYV